MHDIFIEKLRTIYDPEVPVDIYNLGLVYKVDVTDKHEVDITMTLTTATCPAAAYIPEEVVTVVKEITEVKDFHVHIVYDPRWHSGMMSIQAKRELGFY